MHGIIFKTYKLKNVLKFCDCWKTKQDKQNENAFEFNDKNQYTKFECELTENSSNSKLQYESSQAKEIYEINQILLKAELIQKYPLICKELTKQYAKHQKNAVQSLSLRIFPNEIFGLLGPNGCGKTTLLSMFSNQFQPTSGQLFNPASMGFVLQDDAFWEELTVKEHLLFFCRINNNINALFEVNSVIQKVGLEEEKDRKVKELSGGMRRRVSFAIAIVGGGQIVFMDEPTTGLDPESRKQIWDVILKCKENRSIVITTHSMEEADILCERIGFMTQGQLRCIGPQQQLKKLYGNGYSLQLYNQNAEEQIIKSCIKQILPKATNYLYIENSFKFTIPFEEIILSKLFQELEKQKNMLHIRNWGISQPSLQDAFLAIVEKYSVT